MSRWNESYAALGDRFSLTTTAHYLQLTACKCTVLPDWQWQHFKTICSLPLPGLLAPPIFGAPGAGPFFSCLLCTYTVLHSVLPVFMGSARTRFGSGCLWHSRGIEPITLESYPSAYVSTGTRFNRLRDFCLVYSMISGPTFITSSTLKPGFVQTFVPSGIWTLALPDINCKWLKGGGTTVRKSSRHPTWKCSR